MMRLPAHRKQIPDANLQTIDDLIEVCHIMVSSRFEWHQQMTPDPKMLKKYNTLSEGLERD